MDKKTLQELTGSSDFLRTLLVEAAGLGASTGSFEDRERLNYYKSFPEVAEKHARLQKLLSGLIGKMGSFVGVEHGKGLVSTDKAVEILDQYSDNVEILMKKLQEEEQSLRVRKRREQPAEPPRPQKLWDLSHPGRL